MSAVEDVTPDALELFTLTTPAIEILVVGTGDRIEMLPREAMKYVRHLLVITFCTVCAWDRLGALLWTLY